MATSISDFRTPIRAYLGDTHATINQWSADQIDAAVTLVVQLGKAPGVTIDAQDATKLSETVTPTSATQATNWARIVLHAAKRFIIPNAASGSFRTRAYTVSSGEQKEFVFDLLNEVYELEFAERGE